MHGDGKELIEGGDVWVRDGKVMDHRKLFYEEKVSPSKEFDCSGLIVAPGFIDIQINGIAFGLSALLSSTFLLFVCSLVNLVW